jgi:predicted ribosome quality control (RQC) complex YloA/Tae2 family protein
MKKESNKPTTITKKDISEVFNEFYGKVIEPRFDRIESYIQNQIEPRFDRIDKKFEEQDKKFNDLLNHLKIKTTL